MVLLNTFYDKIGDNLKYNTVIYILHYSMLIFYVIILNRVHILIYSFYSDCALEIYFKIENFLY